MKGKGKKRKGKGKERKGKERKGKERKGKGKGKVTHPIAATATPWKNPGTQI